VSPAFHPIESEGESLLVESIISEEEDSGTSVESFNAEDELDSSSSLRFSSEESVPFEHAKINAESVPAKASERIFWKDTIKPPLTYYTEKNKKVCLDRFIQTLKFPWLWPK
jgi:hypothetical protein